MRNLALLVIILHISVTTDAQKKTTRAVYELEIRNDEPYLVNVTATFKDQQDTLFVHPSCPNYDYPDGWSTFITPVSSNLRKTTSNAWIVTRGKKISYQVNLSFIKEQWDVGNEQAGTRIDSSIFIVTRSLFLYAKNTEHYNINFNLPQGYHISAPWESIGPLNFTVWSNQELINNTLVWGPQKNETITIGDFNLQFVMLGYRNEVKGLINQTFNKVVNQYLKIFPNTPKTNYLITLFPHSQNDGEAYESSNAFTLKYEPSEKNKSIWANLLAHELFHKWNGRMINGPNRSKRQWFSEGFTEYYANMALVRSGVISVQEFYHLIEKTIGPYYYFRHRQYRDISLSDAGENKSNYRFGVYNGGWCAAFVMDMMIRRETGDKSLDDFMQHLFAKYGLTRKPYELKDLVSEFNLFLGNEQSFFGDYIMGTEVLPVEQYFKKMGVTLDCTYYEATAFLIEDGESDERLEWLGQR